MKYMRKGCLFLVIVITLMSLSISTLAQENDIKVFIDGKQIIFDVPPKIIDDRTLVPLRAIFEAYGLNINWDEETKTITGSKGDKKVVLTIDSNEAYVNGIKRKIDVPAKIINDRTLVPLRFIGESLGAKVDWDDKTLTVSITKDIPLTYLQNYKRLAVGGIKKYAVDNNGDVWTWVYNTTSGPAGGSKIVSKLNGISDVAYVVAVDYHYFALKKDGTVWAWGNNSTGALGDGIPKNTNVPTKINELTDIIDISFGFSVDEYHILALKKDGTVWARGTNFDGRLGVGSNIDQIAFTPIKNLSGVIAIECGKKYSVALKNDGTVWAWGSNSFGSLGDGTRDNKFEPVKVEGLDNVKAISAGVFHTLALKEDGTVWSWGLNESGQLGDETTTNRYIPVQVKGLNNINAIEAGYSHSLALSSDGTVYMWGCSALGSTINDKYKDDFTTTPVKVEGISNVISIHARGGMENIALTSKGELYTWKYTFKEYDDTESAKKPKVVEGFNLLSR